MKDLALKLKEEGAGLFIESTSDFNPTFGVDEKSEHSKLVNLCSPQVNYSRFSLNYIGLPKPLRAWVSDANNFYNAFGRDGLYIFHYPLNMKMVRRELEEMAETDKFVWDRVKDFPPEKRRCYQPPINPEEYFEQLKSKYGKPSCIHMNLWNYIILLGHRELMQEIMNELKKGPETPFELMHQLLTTEQLEGIILAEKERVRAVHFYDLLGKPKEVHYG